MSAQTGSLMSAMKTMAKIPSPTGLFWSERGAIACARHTPYQGSDHWIWERWEPLPIEVLPEAARIGSTLRCETCGRVADSAT